LKKYKDILQTWIDAINNADIEKILNLYNEEAVLIPTFSNRILDTKEKIYDYFTKVNNKQQLSITLHDNTLIIQEINTRLATLSGIYNWRFDIDGEMFNFEARFSYVVDLTKKSPILNHHSSQIPRTL